MKVALFIPCYVDAFFPEVGIATLELLERLGVDVDYPLDQTCCGQPMANSGCHDDAAGAEALFVKNFAGFDYIVGAVGQLHPPRARPPHRRFRRRRRCRPCAQRTYELVEFLHDVARGRARFPWAEFPHRWGCTTAAPAARAARRPRCRRSSSRLSRSRCACCPRSRASSFVTPERPDECCGFGGTFSVFEEPVSAKMGYDKVNDHQRGRRRVHRLRRHVLPHAPEGLRRAARPAGQVHPHRADPERSAAGR